MMLRRAPPHTPHAIGTMQHTTMIPALVICQCVCVPDCGVPFSSFSCSVAVAVDEVAPEKSSCCSRTTNQRFPRPEEPGKPSPLGSERRRGSATEPQGGPHRLAPSISNGRSLF